MIGVAAVAVLIAWVYRFGAWWYALMALQMCLYFHPLQALAAGAASVMVLVTTALDRRVWHPRSLWMLSPLAVPIFLLWFGMFFRGAAATWPPAWPMFVVVWLPWLLLPIGLYLMARFRSVAKWVIILGISTIASWLSLGTRDVSGMSLSESWL